MLEFEWDAAKSRANIKKHGVSFEESATVFGDPNSLTIPDAQHSGTEKRWVILGRSIAGRLLVVVYTERGERIRLISARPASRKERLVYEENS